MLSVGVSNGFREESTSSQANSGSTFASRLCQKMEENVWCLYYFLFVLISNESLLIKRKHLCTPGVYLGSNTSYLSNHNAHI